MRIALYGNGSSGNHGCEAIVRGTYTLIKEPLTILSEEMDEDIIYGLAKFCNVLDAKNGKISKARLIRAYMKLKLKNNYTDMDGLPYVDSIKKIKGKVDFALSAGGDNYCYPGTDVLAAVNRNIKKKGAKLVLWGCSVEPKLLKNPEIVADLKEFDLITARESISYNALKTININTVKVADPAFTLPKKLLSLPDNWLERNMVGINASPLILQNGKDSNTVYMAYRMLIQEILDHTDCGVALIPHVVCDGNNDLEVLAQLYDEFKDNDRIMLIGDHN